MTYIVGFIVNGIVASVLAGIGALIAAAFPVKDGRVRTRLTRGAVTFALLWLAIMVYGVIDMSRTRHLALTNAEAADVVAEVLNSSDEVLRAERVYSGDSAQTYVLVKMTGEEIQEFTTKYRSRRDAFDAHTAKARGWEPPDWWPERPCPAGVTYTDISFGNPSTPLLYVVNWCPTEGKAYIQRFDY